MGCIDSVMFAGCVDLPKSTMVLHLLFTCSGVRARDRRNVVPSARSQRSLPMKPPPTSNRLPFSSHDSWARYATSGETYSGLRAAMRSGGSTVSVMREPAMGAMVLTRTFFLPPSMARVCAKPCRPSLAIE